MLTIAFSLLQDATQPRWRVGAPVHVVGGSGRSFSGLAALPGGTLVAVEDRGRVSEWSADGVKLREATPAGEADFEDVALDPRDGALWLAIEDSCELVRLDPREWSASGRWTAPHEVPRGSKGLEALAFVPAGGDRFELWLGHQGARSVFVVAEPAATPGELAFVRSFEIGDEPRALVFDLASRSVLAALADSPRIARIDLSGRVLDSIAFAMPPKTVEGLALDRLGRLWACADGGDVVRMAPSGPSLASAGSDGSRARLEHRSTIDVDSKAPEIVALSADRALVLANDSPQGSVDLFPLRLAGGAIEIDAAGRRHACAGEPTSVAAHPALPIAFATVLAEHDTERGSIEALDLRPESLGRTLWTQPVGHHPDNIAISPDGRWAVIANEGEGDVDARSTPGSVTVLDLAGLATRETNSPVTSFEIDVSPGIASDSGAVEPEFVAIDPRSRFAVVTCQENDAAAVIELANPPRLSRTRFALPKGAEPDGVAVLDGFDDPELGRGALVAFAEEGEAERGERVAGQAVSFFWLGPEPSFARAVPISRLDLVGPLDGGKRPQPESVVLFRRRGLFAAVAAERANSVALVDLADPRSPRAISAAPVGARPEGLCLFEQGGRAWLLTGDEGSEGAGTISVVEIVP